MFHQLTLGKLTPEIKGPGYAEPPNLPGHLWFSIGWSPHHHTAPQLLIRSFLVVSFWIFGSFLKFSILEIPENKSRKWIAISNCNQFLGTPRRSFTRYMLIFRGININVTWSTEGVTYVTCDLSMVLSNMVIFIPLCLEDLLF